MKGKRRTLSICTGLGPVICPRCGRRGHLQARFQRRSVSGAISGPYYKIFHVKADSVEQGATNGHRVMLCAKRSQYTCHLGRLSVEKLNQLMKRRPWPITAEDALRSLRRFEERS